MCLLRSGKCDGKLIQSNPVRISSASTLIWVPRIFPQDAHAEASPGFERHRTGSDKSLIIQTRSPETLELVELHRDKSSR